MGSAGRDRATGIGLLPGSEPLPVLAALREARGLVDVGRGTRVTQSPLPSWH